MTEESDSKETAPPEKLLVDTPSDFLFHAAYLAYSKAYDKAADPEVKKQLNENILALQKKEIDGPTFYRNIEKYRAEDIPLRGYSQTMIKTQKKREWRRKVQRSERIERHKK